MKNICWNCMRSISDGVAVCPYCAADRNEIRTPMNALPPETILRGRYLLGRTLGMGGFGITYLGLDLVTMKRVAVKEYFPSGVANRKFDSLGHCKVTPVGEQNEGTFYSGMQNCLKEGKHLALFQNTEQIVSALEYFTENGTAYLVMEYIDGMTLHNYLKKRDGRLEPKEAIELVKPILEVLILMHGKHVLHRDISPDNIMITRDERAVLIDFGASWKMNALSRHGQKALKPGYAAPEQYEADERQGPWTDAYGFCATLYWVITGKAPLDGRNRKEKDTILAPSALGILICPEQEKALMKGLEVEAEERYQNLRELYQALFRTDEKERKNICTDSENELLCRGKRFDVWELIIDLIVLTIIILFALLLLLFY